MKHFLLCLALLSVTVFAPAQTQKLATCKGENPCKACKNCRYCKRCAKEGGKCGVCKKPSGRRVATKAGRPSKRA